MPRPGDDLKETLGDWGLIGGHLDGTLDRIIDDLLRPWKVGAKKCCGLATVSHGDLGINRR